MSIRHWFFSLTELTKENFVYSHVCCQGRNEGAQSSVSYLKAAIRYLCCCQDMITCRTHRFKHKALHYQGQSMYTGIRHLHPKRFRKAHTIFM